MAVARGRHRHGRQEPLILDVGPAGQEVRQRRPDAEVDHGADGPEGSVQVIDFLAQLRRLGVVCQG